MAYEELYMYLLKRKGFEADTVIPTGSNPPGYSGTWSNAEFDDVYTASAPVALSTGSLQIPETSRDNFLFFINGDYVDIDAFQIEQSGSIFKLYVCHDSMSYSIEADDEVYAWGRFEID